MPKRQTMELVKYHTKKNKMTAEQEIWIRAYCTAIETKAHSNCKFIADTALKSYQETFKDYPEKYKPVLIPSQVCPICNGAAEIHALTAAGERSSFLEQCPKCKGERTIPMIQVKPQKSSSAVASVDKAWKEYHEAIEKAKKHLRDHP